MVLETSLLNTQPYYVRIKGKVEQSREGCSASPTPRYSSYWKVAFESLSTTVASYGDSSLKYLPAHIWEML